MKTIKIKSLKLTNFKGIRKLEINDLSNETFIYGDNGTGKTSIFDAFTWLLFGKDSTDRKDFEIKTLDKHNNVIPKIDHEVEAIIDVDGERIELRRIFREKWVTRRGSTEAEFNGNETLYEWNGVPHTASEYSNKISNIVDEKVFKMITNPAAFNSLKWQDQRDVLIEMTGNITDQDVARGDADFEALLSKLTGKTFDEYKKQMKASITKSKTELKTIPTRIDEVERGKPEVLDFAQLNKDLKEKQEALKAVNDQVSDELKAQQALIDKKSEIKTKIQKLDFQISDIKHEYRNQARDLFRKQNSGQEDIKRQIAEKESQLSSSSNGLVTLKSKAKAKKDDMERMSKEIVGYRTQWEQKNAEIINTDDVDTCCPTCKQNLPEGDVDKMKQELHQNLVNKKNETLNEINQKGKSLKEILDATSEEAVDLNIRIENGEKHIEKSKKDIEKLKTQLSGAIAEKPEEQIYNELLSKDTQIKTLSDQAIKLSEQLDNIGGVNVDGLKETRDKIQVEIVQINFKLQNEEIIKKADTRIKELSDEESNLAQAVADMEKELYVIEAFEKEKSTRIEESVNNRFQFVNFKLFETQINGGEVPTCKALINGVPFSDANTASKINAGLDIINTLCMHYKANAPIFIDNRESVVELIPTESQVINLVVSEADKKLRVEANFKQLETA